MRVILVIERYPRERLKRLGRRLVQALEWAGS